MINHKISSNWKYIIGPFLFLLIFHILFVAQGKQPWLPYDEFVQLGYARYMAGGRAFDLINSPFNHFGYAFLILPAFWLFSEPELTYKAILIINAIFASALYFPIYYLLRQLFSIDKKTTTIITLVTCFYPAFIVQTMVAWQDAVIFTFYATSVALFYYFLKKQSYLSTILFSLSVSYLYMMHVRTLAVLVFSILFLLLVAILKKDIRGKVILGAILILISFFVTKAINGIFIKNIGGILDPYSVTELLGRVSNTLVIKSLFIKFLGQLLYLVQATYGLFIFGLLYLLNCIWQAIKKGKQSFFDDKKALALSYILITALGLFFTSVLSLSNLLIRRQDVLTYGRYNELFVAVFIALGLISFYNKKNKEWHYLIIVGIFLLVTPLLHYARIDVAYNYVYNNITGIIIWPLFFEDLNIYYFSAIILFFILILRYLLNRKILWGSILIIILFSINVIAAAILYAYKNYYIASASKLIPHIRSLQADNIYYIEGYMCDKSMSEPFYLFNKFNFYWYIPQSKFEVLKEDDKFVLEHQYLIASVCWIPPEGIRAEIVKQDDNGLQAIWEIK